MTNTLGCLPLFLAILQFLSITLPFERKENRLTTLSYKFLDIFDQCILVRVWFDIPNLLTRVQQLLGPNFNSESSSGETSMISKGCDTAARLVLKELQVEQGPVTGWETRENISPATLVLVAVRELDMGVLERDCPVMRIMIKET
jgi:hypothetical protein